MKRYLSFLAVILLVACTTPRETTTITTTRSNQAMEPEDSIIYYSVPIEIQQKNYLPQMLGSWTLETMQRQTMLSPETLQNISFNLANNGTFTANTGCGTLAGSYSVKGVSIKFNNINSSLNGCNNQEQMSEMVRLLQNTVSMYTIDGNNMTFRDNSSNIVFRAKRM